MPLVVPGITSNSGSDQQSEWLSKLAGKKLSDKTDATVSEPVNLTVASVLPTTLLPVNLVSDSCLWKLRTLPSKTCQNSTESSSLVH